MGRMPKMRARASCLRAPLLLCPPRPPASPTLAAGRHLDTDVGGRRTAGAPTAAPWRCRAAALFSLALSLTLRFSSLHPLFPPQDVGFGWTGPGPLATDINVINRYFDEFFPAAVEVARVLRERGG